MEPKTYTIGHISDILAIPRDRRVGFFAELADVIDRAESALQDNPGVWLRRFQWIDSGSRHIVSSGPGAAAVRHLVDREDGDPADLERLRKIVDEKPQADWTDDEIIALMRSVLADDESARNFVKALRLHSTLAAMMQS